MSWKRAIAGMLVRYRLDEPVKRVVRSRLVTHSRLYQNWVFREVARADALLPQKRPWLVIEPILTCNARCIMCLHSSRELRGEMDMGLFEKLMRECAEWDVNGLLLQGYGEPFADRNWIKRVELCARYGRRYRTVSNASLMRPDVVKRMLELGNWYDVIFSVNGFSAAAYEAMMPPLKRDKTYANVEWFLDLKRSMGLKEPNVRVSCVVTRLNEHEIDDFRDYWAPRLGPGNIMTPDCGDWLGELDVTDLTVKGHSRSKRHAGEGAWLAPCPSPWGQLVVLYDGRVQPCCEDGYARSLIVGDANRQTLKEIFYGPEMNALRAAHRENKRCQHGVCAKCKVNLPWYD